MFTRWDNPSDAMMDELQTRLFPEQTPHTTTRNITNDLLAPDVDSMALIVWLSLTDTLATNLYAGKPPVTV